MNPPPFAAPPAPEIPGPGNPAPEAPSSSLVSQSRTWLLFALKSLALTFLAGLAVTFHSWDASTLNFIRTFNPLWFGALAGMAVIAWTCNAGRTWLLTRTLGHPLSFLQSIGITLSMEFAIAATPGGVGGVMTRFALQKRAGIPLSTSSTMLAADITADILYFSTIAPIAIFGFLRFIPFHTLSRNLHLTEGLIILLFGLALLLFLAFWMSHPTTFRWTRKSVRHGPFGRRFRLAARLHHARRRIREGLGKMRRNIGFLWRRGKGAFLLLLLLSTLQLSCRYGILPVVLLALGHPGPVFPLVILQGALFMLGLIVVLPGGGGTVELVSSLILPLFVPPALIGPALLLWRFFTYHFYLLAGGLTFFFVLQHRHRLFPQRGQPNVS